MKAINFNTLAKDLKEGDNYGATFIDKNGSTHELTIIRTGRNVRIVGEGQTDVAIFRDALTIKAALAMAINAPGRLTSGEVYKAEIGTLCDDNYTADVIHTDTNSYHSTRTLNKAKEAQPYYIGVELELIARNAQCYRAMNRIESNIWHRERDCSIGDSGQEWITCPLRVKDAINQDFWATSMDVLTQFAISRTSTATGLHVHISREAFGASEEAQAETLAKVVFFHDHILSNSTLSRIYGRSESVHYAHINHDDDDNAAKLASLAKIAPALLRADGVADVLKASYSYHNGDRYQRINTAKEATIEFRQGKGQINSEAIATLCQFVDAIVRFCRETPAYKLTAARFIASLPASRKYDNLRRILQGVED